MSRRSARAFSAAVVLLAVLTWFLARFRAEFDLASALLVYLLVVVGVAAIGGRIPALVSAVAAFLLANWFLTPPIGTWKIAHVENVVALTAFVSVSAVVSNFVAVAAIRRIESDRARSEAEVLARLSAAPADAEPLDAVVTHLVASFGLEGAALLRHESGGWVVGAAAGPLRITDPRQATATIAVGSDTVIAWSGQDLSADRTGVLGAFAAQLAAAVERADLAREAARVEALERTNELRTALLRSLAHDLRTPITAIKVAVSSLRDRSLSWEPAQQDLFLATIDQTVDDLNRLVTSLVDLGRIQTGELHPHLRAVALEEVVPAVVHRLSSNRVELDLPSDLPDVAADPVLLERVVANLTSNAIRYTPPTSTLTVQGRVVGATVVLQVIDHGPGITAALRHEAVRPFRRLGSTSDGDSEGLGLGLAIADAFVRAMDGELTLHETPGGGLTASVTMPALTARGER